MAIFMVKRLHQMQILTTPCRRPHRDIWNQVLVHPIQNLNDKVMPSERSQDGLGWHWMSGAMDMCTMALKLGQEPPHSPKNPREALSTPRDVGQWAKGIGWRPKVTKLPQTFRHANKHRLEQYGALVYDGFNVGFDPRAARYSSIDRWCGAGVAPTPPIHYK